MSSVEDQQHVLRGKWEGRLDPAIRNSDPRDFAILAVGAADHRVAGRLEGTTDDGVVELLK